MEFALLPNSKVVCLKKGIISPIKIERPLALKVYSVLCSIIIISQFMGFVNIVDEIYLITFRDVEKSLPCVKGGGTACRDGGIVKLNFIINNPSTAFGVSSLYTREPLYVHL